MQNELLIKGTLAKNASYKLSVTDAEIKDKALLAIADALEANCERILMANQADLDNAEKNGMTKAMLDRLRLTKERISSMAEGVRQVAALPDPIGEIIDEWERPNGLKIAKKRVPMGVIAIIYEARPNVTVDAGALCLKTSNAVVLRGGSEAIRSNVEIMKIMQEAAYANGICEGSLNIIEDTSRETATGLMQLNGYIDMLIPRGGQGLIRAVVQNATVPVVETAAGNCHIYVDEKCDFDMAEKIILNAKVSRPSVCNACETLLIHEKIAKDFLPVITKALKEHNVEIRACEKCIELLPELGKATEDDWYKEYNDYIIAVRIVKDLDEAIAHINKYNTGHSDAIITDDAAHAEKFLNEIDAAAVYVNASTRFTDGFEFGFGAEIGISTQKMHARGPMGLNELTSVKYIIHGNGQIR
mgnify:CR=1 FL=1